LLTRLDVAFSRDQAEKRYVQHSLKENSADVWACLQRGASLYVCGDADKMAPDVHQALRDIAIEQGGLSHEQAEDYLRQLNREVRDERRRQKLEPLYQFMVRLRLPGGVLTTDQWLGLDSRGACGDVNRNVISNVNPHQSQLHGEIHELSLAISERLRWRSAAYAEIWLGEECVEKLGEEEEPFYGHKYLPRKFKIALAVPPENDCDVFANDIGLIAIVEDGHIRGFNVVVGGGMGLTYGDPATYPRLATMAGYVPKEQIVDACEAICAIQRDFGDRTNRAHARFKYTIDDYGMDWFRERFAEYHGQDLEKPRSFSLSRNGDRFGWVEGEDGNQHLTLLISTGRVADTENGMLRTALRKIAKIHNGSSGCHRRGVQVGCRQPQFAVTPELHGLCRFSNLRPGDGRSRAFPAGVCDPSGTDHGGRRVGTRCHQFTHYWLPQRLCPPISGGDRVDGQSAG